MKYKLIYSTIIVFFTLKSYALGSFFIDGNNTAKYIQSNYNKTVNDCGEEKPAFMCSGVLLKFADSDNNSWVQKNTLMGLSGMTFSYLRKDSKFNNFESDYTNGLIIFPHDYVPKSKKISPEVLCAYPLTARIENRNNQGCGSHSAFPIDSRLCQKQGVFTAEKWVEHFYKVKGDYHQRAHQCGFDVSINSQFNSVEGFYQFIQAKKKISSLTPNEVRLVSWNTKDNDYLQKLPIEAFFYAKKKSTFLDQKSLNRARYDQKIFYQKTGQLLPIIQLFFPDFINGDANFNYNNDDQLLYMEKNNRNCKNYVKSASWVNRYDYGFKKNIYSLKVIPTECGRHIQEPETNSFFNEMASKFYFDDEWINNSDNQTSNIKSMHRQLTCHFIIARNKPTWNLEPSRPYTSIQNAIKNNCNNI